MVELFVLGPRKSPLRSVNKDSMVLLNKLSTDPLLGDEEPAQNPPQYSKRGYREVSKGSSFIGSMDLEGSRYNLRSRGSSTLIKEELDEGLGLSFVRIVKSFVRCKRSNIHIA